ncbi:MAG TPA: MurR/RpiR family transcriptional regulator [Candidatus Fimenecus excrementavium]|jgi:DNA-binding MurR/RpiR family transcriptional regulator|nr:MurR/RpiR family transcriptional regulator [Candidatus Fimenecus excrementavium]
MSDPLLATIDENLKRLSKGHKKIAAYIEENYDKAAFMTAAALGQKVGVSESTVVRFATELGFKGYPELQKELQQLIKSKLTAVQRMEVSENLIGDSDIITSVLNGDIELIRATAEKTSREAFKNAVSEINRAKRIYILGVRSSAALASFLAFYFNLVFDAVTLIDTASASEMFEQMFRIDEKDVCIAISFPRYSKQTVNALRFIADRGAKIIAITDTEKSPIASFANHLLVARSDMASVVDSLTAPLSLINALIAGVTLSRRNEVYENFNKLEHIWDVYQVYEKAEDFPEHAE